LDVCIARKSRLVSCSKSLSRALSRPPSRADGHASISTREVRRGEETRASFNHSDAIAITDQIMTWTGGISTKVNIMLRFSETFICILAVITLSGLSSSHFLHYLGKFVEQQIFLIVFSFFLSFLQFVSPLFFHATILFA
jgi:hypothetical protein